MTEYLDRPIDFNDPRVASILDEMSYWSSRFASLIFEHLELRRGINALDVGFGTGCPLFELAHMHGASCQFTGIDVWPAAIERAALKLAIYNLPNVRLLAYDGGVFPLPDAHFDLIVSNLGVNNFENPQAVLAECARVARPQARIVLTTNVKGHMHEFYDVYQRVLEDLGLTQYLDRLAANEDHRGTQAGFTALVEDAGFRITRVIEQQFTLRYLDGSAFFRHFFVRLGFLDGWRRVVDPGDERAVFEVLETRLNETAAAQGGLSLTIPMLYLEGTRP